MEQKSHGEPMTTDGWSGSGQPADLSENSNEVSAARGADRGDVSGDVRGVGGLRSAVDAGGAAECVGEHACAVSRALVGGSCENESWFSLWAAITRSSRDCIRGAVTDGAPRAAAWHSLPGADLRPTESASR